MDVAILGIGTMGAGMARSMRRAGLGVTAWNRHRDNADALAASGIDVAESVGAAVDGADVVLTMLFDTDSVLAVTDELVGALGDEAVWLQSATVGPNGIARIADRAGPVPLLDAPVLGTKKPAEDGTLVPFVSGPAHLVERSTPVLDAIGSKTVVAGDTLGPASALKVACNAWILTITAAVAQSVAAARGLGVDPQLFLEAIGGQAADSPYAQLKGKAMIAGDYTPSFGLDGGRKDLGLIADALRGAGVDASVAETVLARYDRSSADGHGDDDLAAVVTAF